MLNIGSIVQPFGHVEVGEYVVEELLLSLYGRVLLDVPVFTLQILSQLKTYFIYKEIRKLDFNLNVQYEGMTHLEL